MSKEPQPFTHFSIRLSTHSNIEHWSPYIIYNSVFTGIYIPYMIYPSVIYSQERTTTCVSM